MYPDSGKKDLMTVFSNQQVSGDHRPTDGGFSLIYNSDDQSVCVESVYRDRSSILCTKAGVVK